MGNCQAIDTATLVIQHPNGKVEKLYWPVTATEIMRLNPGHYVALLITTTLYHHHHTTNKKTEYSGKSLVTYNEDNKKTSSTTTTTIPNTTTATTTNNNNSVRVTRVKLLRPTDTLSLGHVYRLITTQEVMKGLVAKKQAKLKKHGIKEVTEEDLESIKHIQRTATKHQLIDQIRLHQVNNKHERHNRSSSRTATNTAVKSKGSSSWQPSLQSISEAAS